MPACLEPTSPATRRRPAPRSSTSTSYDVDLDLTVVRQGLREHHRDPRSPAPSPARRPSPTWSARPSTRSRSTARRSTRSTAYGDSRIQLDDLAGRQRAARRRRAALQPHRRGPAPLRRPGRRPGLPLHPVRGARRPPRLHHLRAARPQGVVHLHRDRARALGGRLQRADAGARAARRRRRPVWRFPTDQADVDVHHRARRRRVPRGARRLRGQARRRSRSASSAAQSLVEHLDADELVEVTKQGFAFFEDAFDFPYPFGKYDQLFVPEYNMGAMENAGGVTLRDEYLPRSRQDRARSTSAAPTRSCTRWRTCGSATWSR